MGVVLNPLALKLGYTISWLDAWVSHRVIYSTFLHSILKLRLLLNYIFFVYFGKRKVIWVYSHCNIFIFSNQIFMNIYFYNMRTKRPRIRRTFRGLRYVNWKKMKTLSVWYKKQTLDRNIFAQRFFKFTRQARFFYDLLDYANVGPLLGWNEDYKKLKKVQRKKNCKTKKKI